MATEKKSDWRKDVMPIQEVNYIKSSDQDFIILEFLDDGNYGKVVEWFDEKKGEDVEFQPVEFKVKLLDGKEALYSTTAKSITAELDKFLDKIGTLKGRRVEIRKVQKGKIWIYELKLLN